MAASSIALREICSYAKEHPPAGFRPAETGRKIGLFYVFARAGGEPGGGSLLSRSPDADMAARAQQRRRRLLCCRDNIDLASAGQERNDAPDRNPSVHSCGRFCTAWGAISRA